MFLLFACNRVGLNKLRHAGKERARQPLTFARSRASHPPPLVLSIPPPPLPTWSSFLSFLPLYPLSQPHEGRLTYQSAFSRGAFSSQLFSQSTRPLRSLDTSLSTLVRLLPSTHQHRLICCGCDVIIVMGLAQVAPAYFLQYQNWRVACIDC